MEPRGPFALVDDALDAQPVVRVEAGEAKVGGGGLGRERAGARYRSASTKPMATSTAVIRIASTMAPTRSTRLKRFRVLA